MKQFASFIRKEIYHISRDTRTMLILLMIPILLLLLFGFAITTEINNVPFQVLDKSKSEESRSLIERFNNNPYFNLRGSLTEDKQIEEQFKKGGIKLVIVFPQGFNTHIQHEGNTSIQLIVDASEPNEASTIVSYAQQLIIQHQKEQTKTRVVPYTLNVTTKMLYNPQLKSAYNFVPGIMGMILMLICAMMTSVAIVREKEEGTMEILLVSPIKPIYIVLAKAVPYFLISVVNVITILVIAYFILEVPIRGNLFLLLLLCIVFIFSALAFGLLISSVTQTQQAAMMISGVGLMLPTLLLSGLIFPVENMPLPLQAVSNLIPAKWFITALKDVMIKGVGFYSIIKEFSVLLVMTVVLIIISVKKFKSRL